MNRRLRPWLSTVAILPVAITSAWAGPNGSSVVAGSASVQGQGTASVVVNQTSQNAVINWNTFNVGSKESTTINMPGGSSTELDRVTGGLGPSQILGSLQSNGKVFLVNPDGILFGEGAKVNTGSLLATTHDIANSDFMAGRYNFSGPGNPAASIVNQGSITAQTGGFAALVAPGVRNSGTISARLGTVALASGNAFTLDFYGDNLITLGLNDSIASQVIDVSTGKPLSSLVSNQGRLKANGGRVEMTAVAARAVVDSVINNSGVIEANTIGKHNGMIVLGAATGASKPPGTPTQTVSVSGKLSAAGKRKGTTGGTIVVTGENVQLTGANIDVSGRNGGGAVLIGGDWGDGTPNTSPVSNASAYLEPFLVPTATTTFVDAGTTIEASATNAGNGGKVVVWSNEATTFDGAIQARGGPQSGNGGFVETSGHQQLAFAGSVNTSAPNGKSGTLLLDPQDVTIGTSGIWIVTPYALESALASGNVEITTGSGSGNGDITVAQSISWANSNSLTLSAYRNITIDNGATITNTGAGDLALRADNTGTGMGAVTFNGGSVDFAGSTGTVSIYYDPTGSNKYLNRINYQPFVSGTFSSYTLVNTVSDLEEVSQNLSGKYALGRDIAAGGTTVTPIGDLNHPFTGVFDGLNNTISNLSVYGTGDVVGLFGDVGTVGVVRNIGLTNLSVFGPSGYDVGGLIGRNFGIVSNAYTTGSVSGAAGNNLGPGIAIGGLVGWTYGTITNSYSTTAVSSPTTIDVDLGGLVGGNSHTILQSYASGMVSGQSSVFDNGAANFGGLVGANFGVVSGSYASGAVTAGGDVADVGGLVGANESGGSVVRTYATGAVAGGNSSNVGGLVGLNNNSLVTGSYATGTVTVNGRIFIASQGGFVASEAGGLVGNNDGGFIVQSYAAGRVSGSQPFTLTGGLAAYPTGFVTNSYWDIDTTGQSTSSGGVGLTTLQLKSSPPNGFDETIWGSGSAVMSQYPYLLNFSAGLISETALPVTILQAATSIPNSVLFPNQQIANLNLAVGPTFAIDSDPNNPLFRFVVDVGAGVDAALVFYYVPELCPACDAATLATLTTIARQLLTAEALSVIGRDIILNRQNGLSELRNYLLEQAAEKGIELPLGI
jgi:filamentous hemagglutinin family protein